MTDATVGACLRTATDALRAAGIDGARQDAVLLLAHAMDCDANRIRLDPDATVSADAAAAFAALTARRVAREPVSHLLGHREFWSLDFRVTRDVLDPRPDTEALVEAVLALIPERHKPCRIVDFGTGSGCLLLALLSELPAATGLGVDISPAALPVAADNAQRLGLSGRARFREGDWGGGMEGAFDILVSNPPYIETAAIAALAPEVALHEPRLALDGGSDGLDAYRRLVPDLTRLAAPGAVIALEVGQGQDAAVAALLGAAGVGEIGIRADLGGIRRVVVGRKAA